MKYLLSIILVVAFFATTQSQTPFSLPVPLSSGQGFVVQKQIDVSEAEVIDSAASHQIFLQTQQFWAGYRARKIKELLEIERSLNYLAARQKEYLPEENGFSIFRDISALNDSIYLDTFAAVPNLRYESTLIYRGSRDTVAAYLNPSGNGIIRYRDSTTLVYPIRFVKGKTALRIGSQANSLPGESGPVIYSLIEEKDRIMRFVYIDPIGRISQFILRKRE